MRRGVSARRGLEAVVFAYDACDIICDYMSTTQQYVTPLRSDMIVMLR